MITTKGRGLSSTILPSGIFLACMLPASCWALEMSAMLIDTISAHPEVKEKIHAYRQVISDRKIAASGWRPSVDVEASTGFYDTESPTTGDRSVDYDSTNVEFSLTQNLFNGYDTTYQIEQTEARVTAALYDVYDTADNIALAAIEAYMEILKQRRLLQLSIDNVEAHENILAQIRDRNLSGVGRRSQLQQTEGRLASAQASMIAQQNNLADASSRLHQILGRYVDPEVLFEPELPAMPDTGLDQLIEQALVVHPAMQVAKSNIQAAQSDHRRSLRTRYPNIDLRLATEYGDDIGGLSGTTEETSLILNLSYNFYNGGRKNAEQQQKVSAIYQQKEFAARVRRQIINSLRLSFAADELLSKQIIFLDAHVTKAAQTVESYGEEFFIGQRDLIDLLDAENELNSAKNRLTVARYDSLTARYRVFEGVGRLFKAANINVELDEDNLQIARLVTNEVDKLPIPDDEDQDEKRDHTDHCDNSLPGLSVNPYGCHESVVLSVVEPSLPKQNSAPVLSDDVFTVDANDILVIMPSQLLANDTDIDSDPLEIVDVSQPEFGQLAFNQDNSLVYRPLEGFEGSDRFRYTVSDNNSASIVTTATVIIEVNKPQFVNVTKTQLVNFVYDETELTEISKSNVAAIIEQIKASDDVTVEIHTYTDNIGSDNYNLELSARRADALKNLLVNNGIDADDITAVGLGEKNPIADNSSAAGQAINRRGEFIFRVKTPIQ